MRKWGATVTVSAFSFITPVSSSMVAPAAATIAEQFGIRSTVLQAMSISIFVLAYAIGPLFLAPISEIYGRARLLQFANLWYLAWNLGCGFAQNTGQLLAFRFLAGLGGSAALTVGGGVLSDVWPPEQRGKAIAMYAVAPLLGPIIGPIMGAWITQRTTWRWVFWVTSMADLVIQGIGLFYLQETYAPVLLQRKAKHIRGTMDAEKGPQRPVRTVFDTADRQWQKIFAKALTRPFQLFAYEPIIQLLGVYMAIIYGIMYLFLTTIPSIFQGIYKEDVGIAGLHYIALGLGLMVSVQICARLMDKLFAYYVKKNNGVVKPEYRLPPMVPGTIVLPIGIFITGWGARPSVHWIVPDIGIALIGFGQMLNAQAITTYVIDAFSLHAASALASVTFLRSVAAFGFPLFAPAMYEALGFGKGDTILACVLIVIGCPAPWLFWYYGERIRGASRYAKKA
ncbi:MFS polyamine transporter [Gloeophyllum trabeum ATCC 11539]|uniref:MFS polyamine transporter n=1 Tax=Gloeophyllum trabeum (strain ATCC 11539 / FP-39264 / Madison 617) TaxID=670483 RepID=S7PR93_GLOTA|nr:MFS polyamine transporter [Gloeophyllum trabeum ATCC 11539]EPQ50371.1 MFS polyamine transporter [Gloeophyllum trabeum ATCC 11539]